MLQLRSVLVVADNSGAKKIRLVGVPGFSKKHSVSLGSLIKATVLEAIPNASVKKGDKVNAVIVRTKKECRRPDGSYVRFSDNAAIIVDNSGRPIGSRVIGPIAREIKLAGFNKIASLAKEVV